MYQLITKKGKKYWLTKTEADGIRELLAKGSTFVTISRYDKTMSAGEISEVGVPDWLLPKLKQGCAVGFVFDTPTIELPDGYLEWEEEMGWRKMSGHLKFRLKANETTLKSFEEYIGIKEVKKLQ